MPATLSQEQIDSFERDGFLVLPPISDEVCKNIVQWSAEVKNLPHKPDVWMHYDEIDAKGRRTLSRTENFAKYHQGFNKLFRGKDSGLLQALEHLTGEEMVLFKEKINYKVPFAGGFKAHTDAPDYVHIGNTKHLTVLMAVEPATLENGCLEIVAGSHQISIPMGNDVCVDDAWSEKQTWIPVPLKTGEFLIFGSYLAHRSGPNNSDKGRAAIYATYNALSDGGDRHDDYYADRRIHWPPTADRDPEKKYEHGARLYGFGTPMLTIDAETYKKIGL